MDIGITGLALAIITTLFSLKGLSNNSFFTRYEFSIDGILVRREYERLVTSGFLHVGGLHLALNIISLLLFSGLTEALLGPLRFLLVYCCSLIGGNLLALVIHRNHASYSAAGASGAICGIIFSSIALAPDSSIGFLFLPIALPAWIYGLLFLLYTLYGVRSQQHNIGHEAHLGGAVIGMLITILFFPSALKANPVPILLILLPVFLFLAVLIWRPHIMLVPELFRKKNQDHYSIDHRYNINKRSTQNEVDRILDKINRTGIKSLTSKERQLLDEYSRQSNR